MNGIGGAAARAKRRTNVDRSSLVLEKDGSRTGSAQLSAGFRPRAIFSSVRPPEPDPCPEVLSPVMRATFPPPLPTAAASAGRSRLMIEAEFAAPEMTTVTREVLTARSGPAASSYF